ncbi:MULTISPECIES: sugar phosphate isomerase/epimerase family protein [Pontibacillus]|uniref:Sugar phosphate isomerase/epimerase n=1 Tax=Pontibacillus chungwhensis TaxID=265426 RepID=A0ABY8URF4_9BACI|nr:MULTISPECIES: sugar phosphate isomerase/epimerase [Pontibacillus]MCD5322844.1 sugar phosphate isomerase/epimerase [Pontibacillus sp. HN14]WIF96242.1 sugar phosphate isomerase/epimerase [Pontibacillus chungwhensis]
MTNVFLNTVLLEKNRWEEGQNPSILVSEWISTINEAGFDGLELWQNHYAKSSPQEKEKIKDENFPVSLFNTYIKFEDGWEQERDNIAHMAHQLRCKGVKFNLGSSIENKEMYVTHIKEMLKQLPNTCQLLCECHAGTIMEDPEVAYALLDQIGSERVKIIIHPLQLHLNIEEWFTYFGSTITHAHISLYNQERFHRLRASERFVKERLKEIDRLQFYGTYSIEFTEGVATGEENPRDLLSHAEEDLLLLRHLLKELGA